MKLLIQILILFTLACNLYAGLFDAPEALIYTEKDPVLSHWRQSLSTPSYWIKEPASPFVIDDFEDQNYQFQPTWWFFEDLNLEILENDKEYVRVHQLGDYSLNIKGKTKKWLAGGMGTYLALNGSRFDRFEMTVKGNPEAPVRIEIELYDDDNMNWHIENTRYITMPDEDDKFTYVVDINDSTWQRIQIPLNEFKDDNPKIGDDKWNPNHLEGSGGLIQMQLLIFGEKKNSKVDLRIDSMAFVKTKKDIPLQVLEESPKDVVEEVDELDDLEDDETPEIDTKSSDSE